MAEPEIIVWAGFRAHVLLARDVVGSIIDNAPTWPGLTVDGTGTFSRGEKRILNVTSHGDRSRTTVVVRALSDVWLQELGLTVKVAGPGAWRGYGPKGWVPTTAGVEGWLALAKEKGGVAQAFYSTVHFSRARKSRRYCIGVEYRDGTTRLRFGSDGGFAKLLFDQPPGDVPWEGCSAFDKWPLNGIYIPKWEPLRRWELAGHPPNEGQMHFLGSPGGAGAVVNVDGRTPRPGSNPQAVDRFDRLHRPDTYRRLRAGEEIRQTVTLRRVA